MSLFCCPICGGPLDRGPSAYSCPAGHSFDLAREGYVHLLPANRMHSKMPGDDKGMAAARAAFLSKDYYAPLRDALCSIALERTGPAPRVLDTGCGEGYYTSGVYRALVRAGRSVTMAGTDISKAILRRAAKREKDVEDRIRVLGQEDIHALFQMTPYYWKTPRSGAERLAALTALDVTISFDIHVFCRD